MIQMVAMRAPLQGSSLAKTGPPGVLLQLSISCSSPLLSAITLSLLLTGATLYENHLRVLKVSICLRP